MYDSTNSYRWVKYVHREGTSSKTSKGKIRQKRNAACEESGQGESQMLLVGVAWQSLAIRSHFRSGRLMFMLIFSSSAKCCWNPVTFSLNLERTSIFSASRSLSFCTYKSRS